MGSFFIGAGTGACPDNFCLTFFQKKSGFLFDIRYSPFGTGESRCSICHKPRVQKTAEKWDMHAHTFKIIKPHVSKAMFESNPNQDIIPNSCNQCHVDWAGNAAGYQAGVEGYIERFGE